MLPCFVISLIRWSTGGENGGKAEDTVMNQHYLKNVSNEVCLANAGFNARHWNHYLLPRGRAGKLTDDFVQRLIEHLFPCLYAKVKRAKAAYDRAPEFLSDPISETNMRFTRNLQMITFFWLQDAVVLLDRIPELSSVAPWDLLTRGDSIQSDFERLGTAVKKSLQDAVLIEQTKVLEQNDLLRSVQAGVFHTTSTLDSRLSMVPTDVTLQVERLWLAKEEERREQNIKDVIWATQETYRRMVVAGSGEAVPASCERAWSASHRSASAATALEDSMESDGDADEAEGAAEDSMHGGADEADGVAADSMHGVADGDSRRSCPARTVAGGGSRTLPPGAAADSMAGVADAAAALARDAPWRVPQNAQTQRFPPPPSAQHRQQRRKPRPEPSSSKTGPRADGFYLGNDLNTVSDVWQAYKDLQKYLQDNPEKATCDNTTCGWACTAGSAEEKNQQARLRNRRRLLWDAISSYAGDEEELIDELDQIKEKVGAGISRVELWAQELKKQLRAESQAAAAEVRPLEEVRPQSETTLLSIARAYQLQKNDACNVKQARASGV